jgi:hypothetical protein
VAKSAFDSSGRPSEINATFAATAADGKHAGVVFVGAQDEGLYIHSVVPNSAAADTGLIAAHMRVVSINGRVRRFVFILVFVCVASCFRRMFKD